MLDYAEELEVVEENLFRKVKIDSKRMFRKVRKKKDSIRSMRRMSRS